MNCAICMTAVDAADDVAVCPGCTARYHADCWNETGGCAVYGCTHVPKTEGLKPIEIPPAYWGREDKECPRCGKNILAMAVRCRHCGADVEARPEAQAAYESRLSRKARAPRLRRTAVAMLIASVLPLAALLSVTLGWLYYTRNREDIRRLPGGYDGLYRIAIAVGLAQIAIFAIGISAYLIHGALS
jgi:endogenous inhibitor of DNA gyrase (YacG/DUF329 family)